MNYEIRIREDGKKAIFDENGNMIGSKWFGWYDEIKEDGLIKGESDYFVAEKDEKEAIFDDNGNQISEWFDRIFCE
ncbi:MAG: hypothetical protein ACP5OF_09680, partial [bacterium]